MSALENIEKHLRESIGLDARSVGMGSLAGAIAARMRKRGLKRQEDYFEMLLARESERQALIEETVVPETWFFRDWSPFALLGQWAANTWLPAHPGEVLRVLSAPCSTGEEPYSIAMALLDAGVEPGQFSVEAVDISHQALAQARKGVYGQNSFRGERLEFRGKYFEKAGNAWQLSELVLKQVQFTHANLVELDVAALGVSKDAIFCRNLLIYLTPEMQTGLLSRLRARLSQGGLLFVGHAEAFIASHCGFEAVRPSTAFAFHKRTSTPQPAVSVKRARPKPVPIAPISPFIPMPPMGTREVPPAKPRPSAPVQTPETTLEEIHRAADAGDYEAAITKCEAHVCGHAPSPALFSLLGVLHEATGKLDRAREFYRKALYLEPGHVETLAHLALLERSSGNAAAAHRLEQRARRTPQPHHGAKIA